MCSLAGDVMLEENSTTKGHIKFDICKKCLTEKPSIILRKTDAYCKFCFLPSTVHKFRATLGKHRVIRPNERVLILYQTGHPSTALLHFLRSGLDLSTHKRLRLEPVVIFIDEFKNISLNDRLTLYKKISNEISNYNFEGFATSLFSYIKNINTKVKYLKLNDQLNEESINNMIIEFSYENINLTQFEDTSNTCRRQLLINLAKELNCNVVFTPDISTDVAINLLSNISLGRGSHLSLDVGVLDDRDPQIKILQPLRYFEIKELAFYNIFNNLEPIHISNPKQKITTASVNTLISKFVLDLQDNYPSTVKTVIRTGDKLTCEKTNNVCKICKAPVEIQEHLSSSEAREFSHWVSLNATKLINKETEYNTDNNTDPNLCYGCKSLTNLLTN